jgi:hypothetical protein
MEKPVEIMISSFVKLKPHSCPLSFLLLLPPLSRGNSLSSLTNYTEITKRKDAEEI